MSHTVLPGRTGLPVVGETVPFLADMMSFVDTRIQTFGRTFRTHLLRLNTVISASYHTTLDILRQPSTLVSAHKAYSEFLAALYSSENLLLSGDHTPSRHLATSLLDNVLSQSTLQLYSSHISSLTRNALSVRHAHLSHAFKPVTRVRPYLTFKRAAEYIMFNLILGPLTGDELTRVRTLSSAQLAGVVAAPVSISMLGARSARLRAVEAITELTDIVRQRLCQAENEIEQDEGNDEEMKSTVINQLANVVCSTRPSDRDTVREEATKTVTVLLSAAVIKAVASGVTSGLHALRERGVVEWDGVREMWRRGDYTGVDEILMECIRMFPPIVGAMRVSEKGATVDGCAVDASWRVWMSLFHSNRDEEVYEQGGQFKPERWRGCSNGNRVGCPFAWPGEEEKDSPKMPLSFGAGNRRCKGRGLAWMVMRQLLGTFVEQFDISEDSEMRNESEWYAELRYLPVVRPASDNYVGVRTTGDGKDQAVSQ